MTREEAKHWIPILTMYSKGETIQIKSGFDKPWKDLDDPVFGAIPSQYRLKPKIPTRWRRDGDNCVWDSPEDKLTMPLRACVCPTPEMADYLVSLHNAEVDRLEKEAGL